MTWLSRSDKEEIIYKLNLLLAAAGVTLRREREMADDLQTVLDKAKQEGDLLTAIKVVLDGLKANQNDPVKLQQIVSQLDSNLAAEAIMAGTGVEPPPTV